MAFGGNKAEVAFMARNGYHGLGIAGRMLKHLAVIAKARGIVEFHAEVLSSNTGMLTVFKRSGFPIKLEYGFPVPKHTSTKRFMRCGF